MTTDETTPTGAPIDCKQDGGLAFGVADYPVTRETIMSLVKTKSAQAAEIRRLHEQVKTERRAGIEAAARWLEAQRGDNIATPVYPVREFAAAIRALADAPAADAKAAASDEFAWVIERGDSQPCFPTYWSGVGRWSQDHLEAVRFARKQDAERVAYSIRDGGYHHVCEHGWIAARSGTTAVGPSNG